MIDLQSIATAAQKYIGKEDARQRSPRLMTAGVSVVRDSMKDMSEWKEIIANSREAITKASNEMTIRELHEYCRERYFNNGDGGCRDCIFKWKNDGDWCVFSGLAPGFWRL